MSAPTFDLMTATPAEVDTALADLAQRAFAAEMQAAQQYEEIRSWVGRQIHTEGPSYRRPKASPAEVSAYFEVLHSRPDDQRPSHEESTLLRLRAEWADKRAEFLALTDAQRPYHAEFRLRGGWTRAFLVNNSNGHVHSSRSCSTCFTTTEFLWLPEVSGHAESEIVEMAGERACTVCYPSAPVEVLQRPTQFFTPDEVAKAKAREEREAKRVAKEAAKVVVDGVMGWTNDRGDRHVYPTVRGATNAIAGWLGSLCWYGESHPSSAEWLNNVEKVRAALEAKGVDYDYDKALAAARKKAVRDGGEAKF